MYIIARSFLGPIPEAFRPKARVRGRQTLREKKIKC
jgi:hypothetical protein